MSELIPSARILRVELGGAPVGSNRLVRIMQEGKGPTMPRRLRGFFVSRFPGRLSFCDFAFFDLGEDRFRQRGVSFGRRCEGLLDAGLGVWNIGCLLGDGGDGFFQSRQIRL